MVVDDVLVLQWLMRDMKILNRYDGVVEKENMNITIQGDVPRYVILVVDDQDIRRYMCVAANGTISLHTDIMEAYIVEQIANIDAVIADVHENHPSLISNCEVTVLAATYVFNLSEVSDEALEQRKAIQSAEDKLTAHEMDALKRKWRHEEVGKYQIHSEDV